MEWLRNREGQRGKQGETDGVMECYQGPGDVAYIPRDFGHLTVNVMESIGVAVEFNGKAFS